MKRIFTSKHRATAWPNFIQAWIIDALEWCERRSLSATLLVILFAIGLAAALWAAYEK